MAAGERASAADTIELHGSLTARLLRIVGKTVLLSFILALGINGAFWSWDVWHYFSMANVFDQIAIDMPRQDAEMIFIKYRVPCASERDMKECRFRDFFRLYTITFDPKTDRVNMKRVFLIDRPRALDRILFPLRRLG